MAGLAAFDHGAKVLLEAAIRAVDVAAVGAANSLVEGSSTLITGMGHAPMLPFEPAHANKKR